MTTKSRTPENLTVAGKLLEAMAGVPLDKALIASVAAEAFINGMNAHERLTTDSAPERP